jgi:hypothetical protein
MFELVIYQFEPENERIRRILAGCGQKKDFRPDFENYGHQLLSTTSSLKHGVYVLPDL